jgi:CRP/FNR family transcriptional regulator, dissimilatory nitrate respiration regulator
MISIMSDWQKIFDGAPERALEASVTLFRREDPVHSMYLVRSGRVALERPMGNGTALTLNQATASMALAEASLFATTYHCDAIARVPSVVAALPRAVFLSALRELPNAALSLIEVHAKEVQGQRSRIEILRLRRVADRVDAWLDLYGEPAKGEWTRVADAIGVSQPALYRELSRRRKAGRSTGNNV